MGWLGHVSCDAAFSLLSPLFLPTEQASDANTWLSLSHGGHLVRKLCIANFPFFLRFYAREKTPHGPGVCQ